MGGRRGGGGGRCAFHQSSGGSRVDGSNADFEPTPQRCGTLRQGVGVDLIVCPFPLRLFGAPPLTGRGGADAPVGYCGYEYSGDAKVWTPAEDSLLLEIVKKGQPKAPRWLWALVAEPLVGRSKLAVARHWHTKYRPTCSSRASSTPLGPQFNRADGSSLAFPPQTAFLPLDPTVPSSYPSQHLSTPEQAK